MDEQERTIFNSFTGRNGSGPEALENIEPEAVERVMQNTLNRVALSGMSDEDAQLITGISHHVEGGLFERIARRRGSSWRVVAALADRVVQFEGLAKIHTAISFQTDNMVVVMALKTKSSVQRLKLIQQACAQESAELEELLGPGFEIAIEQVLEVWEKTPRNYWKDARRRMGGDLYE